VSDVVKYSLAEGSHDHQTAFDIAGGGRWIVAKAFAGRGIARRRVIGFRDGAATCRTAHLPQGSDHTAAAVGPLWADLLFVFFNALGVPRGTACSAHRRVCCPLCIGTTQCIDLDLWLSKIGSIGNAVTRNPMLRHHIEGSIPGSNQPAIAQELNHGQGI
jgi:hypothetical protein